MFSDYYVPLYCVAFRRLNASYTSINKHAMPPKKKRQIKNESETIGIRFPIPDNTSLLLESIFSRADRYLTNGAVTGNGDLY